VQGGVGECWGLVGVFWVRASRAAAAIIQSGAPTPTPILSAASSRFEGPKNAEGTLLNPNLCYFSQAITTRRRTRTSSSAMGLKRLNSLANKVQPKRSYRLRSCVSA